MSSDRVVVGAGDVDEYGMTPVLNAISHCDVAQVTSLVLNGALLNGQISSKATMGHLRPTDCAEPALQHLIRCNLGPVSVIITRVLMTHGANPFIRSHIDNKDAFDLIKDLNARHIGEEVFRELQLRDALKQSACLSIGALENYLRTIGAEEPVSFVAISDLCTSEQMVNVLRNYEFSRNFRPAKSFKDTSSGQFSLQEFRQYDNSNGWNAAGNAQNPEFTVSRMHVSQLGGSQTANNNNNSNNTIPANNNNNNTTMNNTTTTTEGGDDGDGYYTYDSDDESSHTPRDITKAEEFQLPVPDGDLGLPHALPATELPQPGFDSPAARLSLAYTNFSVKIVDLGNCHPISQPSRSEIQTHQYRAPEVILGLPYNESADTFSMACVFFEILTGDYLFDSEDGIGFNEDEDHLMMMEQIAGPIPDAMKKGKRGHKFFNPDGSWKRIREPAARWTMDRYLQDKYGLPRALAEAFSSFVTPMLAIDPAQRLTPEAALRHPFMDEKTFDLSDVKEEDLFWEFDEGDDYGYDEPPIDKRGRPKVISERDNKGRKKKPGLIRQREHA
eukprot:comp21962_c0_seq3/m.50179 comp21962_c0_seq3/g.50179  ORF comp21962_c0_seq3/g.50179 comp21962_c0_seq3/m.50179 type:complete len:558 (-) comp21962_c0_seq3:116-1789(-)